jgi:uncharacterized Fe-S center protein
MAVAHADLTLPLFVAGRDFADDMADQLGDMSGRSIVVDATGLSSGTSSFAAQLVTRVLVDGKAAELILVGAPAQFADYARDQARHAGVLEALHTPRHFPVPAER